MEETASIAGEENNTDGALEEGSLSVPKIEED